MNIKKIKDSQGSYEVTYKSPEDGKLKKEIFSSKGAALDFTDNLEAGSFEIKRYKGIQPYEIKPLSAFKDDEIPYPYYFEGMSEVVADVVGMTKKQIEDYISVFF